MCDLFEPLENAIRDHLISPLVGREVFDAERQLLAILLRHGKLRLIQYVIQAYIFLQYLKRNLASFIFNVM